MTHQSRVGLPSRAKNVMNLIEQVEVIRDFELILDDLIEKIKDSRPSRQVEDLIRIVAGKSRDLVI